MHYRHYAWEIPPAFEPVPERAQAYLLASYALAQIEDYCGGWPDTDAGLVRLVRRFTGRRLRFLPRWMKAEAFCRPGGTIYVTEGQPPHVTRHQILHELIEAMCQRDGLPPCVATVGSHDVACVAVSLAS